MENSEWELNLFAEMGMKINWIRLMLFCLLLPFGAMSQEKTDASVQTELMQLRRKYVEQTQRIKELEEKNQNLELQLQTLSEDLDQKLRKNMEVQAQNERAINITLDEFSGKFDQQNKTVKGVKESLDKQLLYQIIFYASGLLLFLLILWIGIQLGIKKALKQQSHKWNEFNEHILKNY